MFRSIFKDLNTDLWFNHVEYVVKNGCSIRYSNFKDYWSWKKPAI